MTKKHHPQNRYERRLLDKQKKSLKPYKAKDIDHDEIRRKISATQEGDGSLKEVH